MLQGSEHIEFEQRQHTLMHRDKESAGAPPLLTFDSAADRIMVGPVPATSPGGDTVPE